MRTKFTLSAACVLVLSAVSCKKDSSGSGALDGNYAFTSTSTKSTATIVVNDPNGDVEKSVTTSDYTSTANKGTVSISGGVMTTKNVSYSVNTTLDYAYYLNNVKDDDASGTQDFSFDMPAFSSAASFKVVSADSLFFTAGASTIGGTTSNSTGARYSISGNTLTMTIKIDTAYIDNSQGFAQQKHDVATQTTILTKQ